VRASISGLDMFTVYYVKVKARNSELAETDWVEAGRILTTDSRHIDTYMFWDSNRNVHMYPLNGWSNIMPRQSLGFVGNFTAENRQNQSAAFRFSLADQNASFTRAVLRINIAQIYKNPVLNLHASEDNTWQRQHGSFPVFSSSDIIQANVTIDTLGWLAFDVTDFVRTQMSRGAATFVLTGADHTDGDFAFFTMVNTRNRPELVFE